MTQSLLLLLPLLLLPLVASAVDRRKWSNKCLLSATLAPPMLLLDPIPPAPPTPPAAEPPG